MPSEEPQAFRVFVGWDSREDEVYQVCRHSLYTRASGPISVEPLRQNALREQGIYTRDVDALSSTEFTFSRFLVPHLAEYEGWALFCDCDFLWLEDVLALAQLADDRYAVMCVHHDHHPPEETKMDGRVQTQYPRKNWSSMVLYNCGHPANAVLTPDLVNTETGLFLHRFSWLDDALVGSVAEDWNWLEGWSSKPDNGTPNVIHYTRGGPWFAEWQSVEYADLWQSECKNWRAAGGTEMWEVFDFWFEECGQEERFRGDAEFDQMLRDRFLDAHTRANKVEFASWRATPQGRVAEIVLLDQFSRNMFRGQPTAFASDALACKLAKEALEAGADKMLPQSQRLFLYLPLEHSENAEDQDLSVKYFATLENERSRNSAVSHREVFLRFGRFPARNDALGRETTAEEAEFMAHPDTPPWSRPRT